MADSIPPVIAWDYQFAPNAQKSRNYLYQTGLPFKICQQPFVLPRPILTDLGVIYRRIPVLSIGKDVYCDNACFIDAIQALAEKHGKGLKRSPFDRAFDSWGYRSFWIALPIVSHQLLTPEMVKDRENLFAVFTRKDFQDLRPNGLSEFRSMLETAEHEFLPKDGPFIGGKECGLADIHAIWVIKWVFQTLEVSKEGGFGQEQFPKVHRWISSLPLQAEAEKSIEQLSGEQASKQILASHYAAPEIGVDPSDPLGLKADEKVAVEANDAEPGTHPQYGKLVGLSKRETVLELDNGLRVHFPRVGYVVKKA